MLKGVSTWTIAIAQCLFFEWLLLSELVELYRGINGPSGDDSFCVGGGVARLSGVGVCWDSARACVLWVNNSEINNHQILTQNESSPTQYSNIQHQWPGLRNLWPSHYEWILPQSCMWSPVCFPGRRRGSHQRSAFFMRSHPKSSREIWIQFCCCWQRRRGCWRLWRYRSSPFTLIPHLDLPHYQLVLSLPHGLKEIKPLLEVVLSQRRNL